jgi:L-fuculose-phosphate aldolase
VLLKSHGVVVATASIEETVISTIMLENAAMIQLVTQAAGPPAKEFPRADIEQLRHDISRPDQFKVNFDYLVRRAKRREGGL